MSEFIVEIEDNFVPPSEDFQCTLCSESLVNEHEFYKHTTEVQLIACHILFGQLTPVHDVSLFDVFRLISRR